MIFGQRGYGQITLWSLFLAIAKSQYVRLLKQGHPKKWTVSSKGAFHGWCFGCPWVLLFFGLRVQKLKQPLQGAGVWFIMQDSSLSAEIPYSCQTLHQHEGMSVKQPRFFGILRSLWVPGRLAFWMSWVDPYCRWKKSSTNGTYKTSVNNGINYQPQLVIAGFLNHQQDRVLLEWSLSFAKFAESMASNIPEYPSYPYLK